MTSVPSTSDGFKTPPPMPPGHVYTPYNKLVTSSSTPHLPSAGSVPVILTTSDYKKMGLCF